MSKYNSEYISENNDDILVHKKGIRIHIDKYEDAMYVDLSHKDLKELLKLLDKKRREQI